jgi:predicted Zn-dependent protease
MHLIRQALFPILIMAFVIGVRPAPCAGFFTSMHLTTKEEEKLGREFMLYARKSLTLIKDPFIVNYINKIGQLIVAQHPSPPFEFHFYVVNEDTYNAFAAPGGHVFMYRGLLAAMDSEEELAGILAHEVAHVLSRHISEQIARQKKIGLATLAGILTGVFLGGSPAASGAITTGSIAAGQSLSLKYSRANETEADQVGLKYLTKAGYGAEGLLKILYKIREKQWFGPDQMPSYLSTHPAVDARIVYLDTWIQTQHEREILASPRHLSDFFKVRTKLIALYEDPTVAHNTFDALLREDKDDALAFYGRGLVLGREGKKDEAVENLRKAALLRPLDADILRDLGKAYFNKGDYGMALMTLRGVLAFNPRDLEGRFLLGRAQMETGDSEGAVKTFEGLLEVRPDYLPGVYYLGEMYGKLGNLAEAHYHLGIYYKKKGHLKNARFHLERALKLTTKDPARREAIKRALKELPARQGSDRNEKSAW